MAPRDAVPGSKRKSADRTSEKFSKKPKFEKPKFEKPKFEKRPPPPTESDDVSEDDEFEAFSDDAEDGGASLKKASGRQSNGSAAPDGKVFERGQNSRESHQKQKQLALERRNHKPLADDSHRLKKIWERLRRKSHVPKEERDKLVEELFSIVTGRIKEFTLKHDTVRVVQTAIKYSTLERRRMIADELKGTYSQLAESKYAKFLIGKLLVEGDKDVRDLIVPEFYGKVRKLINHPEASWILDDIYRGVATPDQKAILLREWYGPEFAIFRTAADEKPTAELSKIIEEQPSKRATIMRYLVDLTNQLVQKKMTGFTMLHDAMLQYYLNAQAGTEEAKEYIEMIKEDESDLLKNMAFTKSGARLVSLMLAHGSAKDRKQVLKAYKDTFQLMATDAYAHVVILTAYDVVDDTVLTSKAIFPELLGKSAENELTNVVICANDPHARLTIRYLFEGASKQLFDLAHAHDLQILEEIWEIRKSTSKKDAEIRRKELISALSPTILSAIETSPEDLVSSSFGCQMVGNVLLSAVGDKSKALQAVANTAGGDPDTGDDATEPSESTEDKGPPSPHISRTLHGGRMLKTLIAGGHFDRATRQIKPVDPPLHFSDILYPVIKEHAVSWATGPSSFVILGLLEAEDFSHKAELKSILKKETQTLQRAATEETAEQKASREAAEPSGEATKPAKKGKKGGPKKDRTVGNVGTKLVLEQLN